MKVTMIMVLGVVAAAAVALGVACGDDDGAAPTAEPDPVADPVADPGPAEIDETVDVILREWEVAPSTQSVNAGAIQFFAENEGEDAHELVICRDSCEEGAVAELAEVENVVPGTRRTFSIDLEPGEYELACLIVETKPNGDIEDHYELGMHTKFIVE